MCFRAYNPDTDLEAVRRIWRETGWIEGKDEHKAVMDLLLECCRGSVAEIAGEAECLVLTGPGTIRYLDEALPFSCVAGVTTSRIARKMGFAGQLTARAIADDVAEGALVSGLGMFEQGYYDRLGFGSGGYVDRISFDPADLKVPRPSRPPKRLLEKDYEAVHACRLARQPHHGQCSFTSPQIPRADILWEAEKNFGLGWFDGPHGELTHQVWFRVRGEMETGPYSVFYLDWQNKDQFLELMGLIRNLDDQVRMVTIRESHGIQFQDLLGKPFRFRTITKGSEFDARPWIGAYWQMRMNDIPGCLAKTHLPNVETVRFNLEVTDPIATLLPNDAPWRGVAGVYKVVLGPESSAIKGTDKTLPTLRASVNAFTRMWLGIRSATALTFTDDLDAPPELLTTLDRILRLPDPQPDWDF